MCIIIITPKTLGEDFQLLGEWFIDDKKYTGVLKIDPENNKLTKLTLSVDDNFCLTKIKQIKGKVTNINYYLSDCVYDIHSSFGNLKTFTCSFLLIDNESESIYGYPIPFNFNCHSLSVYVPNFRLTSNFVPLNSTDESFLLFKSDKNNLTIVFTPYVESYGFSNSGYIEINSKNEKDFSELISILNKFSCFIFLFHNQFISYQPNVARLNKHFNYVPENYKDSINIDSIPYFYSDYKGLAGYNLLGLSENKINNKPYFFSFKNICPDFTKNSSNYFNRLMDLLNSSNTKDQLFIDSFSLFIDTCSGVITDDLRIYQSQMSVLEGLYKYFFADCSEDEIYDAQWHKLNKKLNNLYSLTQIKKNNPKFSEDLEIINKFRTYVDKDLKKIGINIKYIVYLRNYVTHLTKDVEFEKIDEKLALTKLVSFNHVLILFYLLYFIGVSPKDLDGIIKAHFQNI